MKGGLCERDLCEGGLRERGHRPPVATEAGGTHPTGMHSCFKPTLVNVLLDLDD